MNTLVRGAWASLIATTSMAVTSFRTVQGLPTVQKSLYPPSLWVKKDKNKKTKHEQLTMASSIGYGLIGGMIYAAVASKSEGNPLVKGGLFGFAVWAGSKYGWIPGVRLNSSPEKTKQKDVMIFLSHIIWGVSLGYAEYQLQHHAENRPAAAEKNIF